MRKLYFLKSFCAKTQGDLLKYFVHFSSVSKVRHDKSYTEIEKVNFCVLTFVSKGDKKSCFYYYLPLNNIKENTKHVFVIFCLQFLHIYVHPFKCMKIIAV